MMNPAMDAALSSLRRGRIADARQACQSALRKAPRDVGWLRLAAEVERSAGHPALAAELLSAVCALSPDDPDAHQALGQLLGTLGHWPLALDRFRHAATLKGATLPLLMQMAQALWTLGRTSEALACTTQALSLQGADAAIRLQHALLLKEAGRFEDALGSLDQLLAADPGLVSAWLHRGTVLQSLGHSADARQCYEKVLEIEPGHALAHAYLGLIEAQAGHVTEARSRYARALQQDSQNPVAHDLLARLELAECNFEVGWREYAWRHRSRPDAWTQRLAPLPEWDGITRSQVLLVASEQGLGDQILFASMFGDLAHKAQVGGIAVHAKLLSLMQRSWPELTFFDANQPMPGLPWDACIRMGDLGRVLRPTVASVEAARRPYLRPDANRVQQLARVLPAGGGPLIGLSWKSQRAEGGRAKSLTLPQLAGALQHVAGARFVNLQYGDVDDEIAALLAATGIAVHQVPGVDPTDDLESLAALLQLCDHVVSTSNTTAHLSGALGRPTWVLLPRGPGRLWYWSERNGRSTWYASVKLLPQAEPGDWSAPLQLLAAALADMTHA